MVLIRVSHLFSLGIAEGRETAFTLPHTTANYTVVGRFTNITFPEAGTYWVEVMLNDNLLQRFPLTLVEEEPD